MTQVKTRFPMWLMGSLLFGTVCFGYYQDYDLADARRMFDLIDKIKKETLNKAENHLHRVEVTEEEFNAYIAYLIEIKQEEVLKEMELKLKDDNRIEGRLFIDLKGQKIPKLLRPQMNLFLGGRMETQEGRMRIVLKEMFIEGQPVQPRLLDLVIYIGSRITGDEPWSINDWFDLPFGIRKIEVKQGKAIVTY